MKRNKHPSLGERSKISVLQSSGESVHSIARILGRSPSTISNYITSTTHAYVQERWKNVHRTNGAQRGINFTAPPTS